GARVAVVNLEPSGLDFMADWILYGKSGEILPRLI
ncbi:MAG: NAD-dependent protein deacylase, partial [Acidobacteria bacterium]